MTTDVTYEGESARESPSVSDVVSELTAVRQHEGLTPRRVERHGTKLQLLPISQQEFRHAGSEPGTLPMATVTALQCAVNVYHPESIHALVLHATLNLDGKHSTLTERQTDLANSLGIKSMTTYESIERDVYKIFGFRIRNAQRSFCRNTDIAAAIARLPIAERTALIRLLLGIRISDYSLDQDVSAAELLRHLPGLSSIKSMMYTKGIRIDLDRLLTAVLASEVYDTAQRDELGAFGQLALQTNTLVFRSVLRSQNRTSTNEIAQLIDRQAAVLDQASYGVLLAKFPNLSIGSRLRLRVLRRGLFFDGKQYTPSFDRIVQGGLDRFARVLVQIDTSYQWTSVFDEGNTSKLDAGEDKTPQNIKEDLGDKESGWQDKGGSSGQSRS